MSIVEELRINQQMLTLEDEQRILSKFVAGPTVAEACESRIRTITRKIQELEDEKRLLKKRADQYAGSSMLESERVATDAERFLKPFNESGII